MESRTTQLAEDPTISIKQQRKYSAVFCYSLVRLVSADRQWLNRNNVVVVCWRPRDCFNYAHLEVTHVLQYHCYAVSPNEENRTVAQKKKKCYWHKRSDNRLFHLSFSFRAMAFSVSLLSLSRQISPANRSIFILLLPLHLVFAFITIFHWYGNVNGEYTCAKKNSSADFAYHPAVVSHRNSIHTYLPPYYTLFLSRLTPRSMISMESELYFKHSIDLQYQTDLLHSIVCM